MQALQAGKLGQAQAIYEKILQINADDSDALLWMGVVHHQRSNTNESLNCINRAIRLKPDSSHFQIILGNVYKDLLQFSEAENAYKSALILSPNNAEASNNMGVLLCVLKDFSAAAEYFKRAISIAPRYVDAYNGLGAALEAGGKPEQAKAAFRDALRINPDHGQALLNLGRMCIENDPKKAFDLVQKSLAQQPNSFLGWVISGIISLRSNQIREAQLFLDKAFSLNPLNGIRVASALALPVIMGTIDELKLIREEFELSLEKLTKEKLVINDPIKEFCTPNFQLAYHGLNDKSLNQLTAYFYEQACPSLLFVAPHCNTFRKLQHRKRIGFVSRNLVNHSVASCSRVLINSLMSDIRFEIYIISNSESDDESIRAAYPNILENFIRIPSELEAARLKIASLELDVLLYLDIGMDAYSYFLAYARLAHVQGVLDGHPVTTGISNLDYFFSCDLAEPENADEHYSEKLIRLPFGAYYFEKPQLPHRFKTRFELGLPVGKNIYICPMTLFKLHPDFDEAITQILRLDPLGVVIFFAAKNQPNWQKSIEERFDKTVAADVRSRISFIPWLVDSKDFMSVLEKSNVILDPFHFGLGSTAIITCAVGTPFVTKPGKFARGRYGYYYCRLMNLMECVANDTEDYARKAVAIATDGSLRESIKIKLLANNGALLGNDQGIHEMRDFLLQIEA